MSKRTAPEMLPILLILSLSLSVATGASRDPGSVELSQSGVIEKTPSYADLLESSWDEYNADLSYSSQVLSDYLRKNITSREALAATAAVLTLTKETEEDLIRAHPSQEYSGRHNYTLGALAYLKDHLREMARFYETLDKAHIAKARESFNRSTYYREKALEESMISNSGGRAGLLEGR